MSEPNTSTLTTSDPQQPDMAIWWKALAFRLRAKLETEMRKPGKAKEHARTAFL
jgi:hypothetical protein